MIVKKFEARTMKEALEMIKKEFGPEAIILQAKDHSRRFGLLGQGSVEVTAAISEESLQKKKLVENKLPDQKKNEFYSIPAKKQKEWVEKFLESYNKKQPSHSFLEDTQETELKGPILNSKNPIAEKKFIEIQDDDTDLPRKSMTSHRSLLEESKNDQLSSLLQHSSLASYDVVEDLKQEIVNLKKLVLEKQLSGNSQEPVLGTRPEWESLAKKLIQAGLRAETVKNILALAEQNVEEGKKGVLPFVESWLIVWLKQNIALTYPSEKVQFILGNSGIGRTQFLVKWAIYLKQREAKRVAIVNADHSKMGASQQLRTWANILGVSFAKVTDSSEWKSLLEELNSFDHILVDCPPIHLGDYDGLEQVLKLMNKTPLSYHKHLLLPASFIGAEGERYFDFVRSLKPSSMSWTRVDEREARAGIWELSYRAQCPLFAMSFSSKLNAGFEVFTIERIIDFVLQISKRPLQQGLEA